MSDRLSQWVSSRQLILRHFKVQMRTPAPVVIETTEAGQSSHFRGVVSPGLSPLVPGRLVQGIRPLEAPNSDLSNAIGERQTPVDMEPQRSQLVKPIVVQTSAPTASVHRSGNTQNAVDELIVGADQVIGAVKHSVGSGYPLERPLYEMLEPKSVTEAAHDRASKPAEIRQKPELQRHGAIRPITTVNDLSPQQNSESDFFQADIAGQEQSDSSTGMSGRRHVGDSGAPLSSDPAINLQETGLSQSALAAQVVSQASGAERTLSHASVRHELHSRRDIAPGVVQTGDGSYRGASNGMVDSSLEGTEGDKQTADEDPGVQHQHAIPSSTEKAESAVKEASLESVYSLDESPDVYGQSAKVIPGMADHSTEGSNDSEVRSTVKNVDDFSRLPSVGRDRSKHLLLPRRSSGPQATEDVSEMGTGDTHIQEQEVSPQLQHTVEPVAARHRRSVSRSPDLIPSESAVEKRHSISVSATQASTETLRRSVSQSQITAQTSAHTLTQIASRVTVPSPEVAVHNPATGIEVVTVHGDKEDRLRQPGVGMDTLAQSSESESSSDSFDGKHRALREVEAALPRVPEHGGGDQDGAVVEEKRGSAYATMQKNSLAGRRTEEQPALPAIEHVRPRRGELDGMAGRQGGGAAAPPARNAGGHRPGPKHVGSEEGAAAVELFSKGGARLSPKDWAEKLLGRAEVPPAGLRPEVVPPKASLSELDQIPRVKSAEQEATSSDRAPAGRTVSPSSSTYANQGSVDALSVTSDGLLAENRDTVGTSQGSVDVAQVPHGTFASLASDVPQPETLSARQAEFNLLDRMPGAHGPQTISSEHTIASLDVPQVHTLSPSQRDTLRLSVGATVDGIRVVTSRLVDNALEREGADAVAGGRVIGMHQRIHPDTPQWTGLLAHELTHVGQQDTPGFVPMALRGPNASTAIERAGVEDQDTERDAELVESLVTTQLAARQNGRSDDDDIPSDALSSQRLSGADGHQDEPESRELSSRAPQDAWGELPAPWEPLPDWLTAPGPLLALEEGSSAEPSGLESDSGQVAAPVQFARVDREPREEPDEGDTRAGSRENKSRESGPDLDALARKVYASLRRKLMADHRRSRSG